MIKEEEVLEAGKAEKIDTIEARMGRFEESVNSTVAEIMEEFIQLMREKVNFFWEMRQQKIILMMMVTCCPLAH